MKKKQKITIIFIFTIIVALILPCVSNAGIFDTARAFLREGSANTGMLSEEARLAQKTKEGLGKLFGLSVQTKTGFEELIDTLWSIGLLTIFISTVIIGIKYMLVLPEERSRIKQATTPYVIGVVIIFGSLTIWRFVIIVLDGSLR